MYLLLLIENGLRSRTQYWVWQATVLLTVKVSLTGCSSDGEHTSRVRPKQTKPALYNLRRGMIIFHTVASPRSLFANICFLSCFELLLTDYTTGHRGWFGTTAVRSRMFCFLEYHTSLSGGLRFDIVTARGRRNTCSTCSLKSIQYYYHSLSFQPRHNILLAHYYFSICAFYFVVAVPEKPFGARRVFVYIQSKMSWTAHIPLTVWWEWISENAVYCGYFNFCKIRHPSLFVCKC